MKTNIKIDYKSLLPNYSEFEQKLYQNLSKIDYEKPSILDLKTAHESTSYDSWLHIKNQEVFVAKQKNLIDFKSQDLNRNLIRFLIEMFPGYAIMPSGHFLYPPGGYMSWHTNSDMPCERLYIAVVDHPNRSCFKYINNYQLVEDWDNDLIVIRKFTCGEHVPFWHAVYSECNRYSFGYRLYNLA